MVWKGIQVHDVMQQAGYCAQGSGKFSWQDLFFRPLSMEPIDKKPNHCFPTITIDLDTTNG
jgi:hypothetical protein